MIGTNLSGSLGQDTLFPPLAGGETTGNLPQKDIDMETTDNNFPFSSQATLKG